jgi:ring-1,2-phenylacetyl-CoA epoxidase subunit PaaC
MASGSIQVTETPLLSYLLRRADDALVLGHRLSEWCGRAPTMEEEMALANMGLDLIGQARSLYGYAAVVDGGGRDQDAYAYLRDERGYRNLLLVEQPNGDFACTILRQFFYAAFAESYWRAMMASRDATLAAIAVKAEKEMAYHTRHCAEWVIRLGDGNTESRTRITAALNVLWPFIAELFEVDEIEQAAIDEGIGVDLQTLRDDWRESVVRVFAQATLDVPQDYYMRKGGRNGRHSEHLGHMLAEMQYLQRTLPGVTW